MEIINRLDGITINFEKEDNNQEKRLIRAKIEEFLSITIMIKENTVRG